jgi:hypothetical protein
MDIGHCRLLHSKAARRQSPTSDNFVHISEIKNNYTPWNESASELHRPSDRRLPAKLVPTLVERGCHVVSVTDPYGRNLGYLNLSRYFFFQVAPQLYSEAEWTPFQTHYFLENLVVPEIEPEPLDCSQEL